jgi:hypothetical protein
MKTINQILKTSLVLALSLLVLTSCDKCKEDSTENISSAEDVLRMDMEENDFTAEELYVSNPCNLDLSQIISSCAVITESSTTFPKTITIDYGTGCVDAKGRTKKGKVFVTLNREIQQTGSIREVTFENFFINDVQISGTRTAENMGLNESDNVVIKVTGNITATHPDYTRSRTFERYREWTKGFNTCDTQDDEFLITGSGTLINRFGKEIPHTIVEPIHITPGQCNYPLAGKIDVGNSNRGIVIDFGNENCDNLAEIKTKRRNKTYQVNLDTRTIIH